MNLDEVEPADIQVFSDTLTIHLPPPKILNEDNVIVDTRSQLYIFQKGLFAPDSGELVPKVTDRAIREILDEANRQAVRTLEILFSAAGFAEVKVKTQAGTCP